MRRVNGTKKKKKRKRNHIGKNKKERDVTPRNSRHCPLADVTVNFILPHVLLCHYVITTKHAAKVLSGACYGSSVVLISTPVVHIRTAAIST